MGNPVELLFHRVYEMADLMADIVENSAHDCFDELEWSSSNVSTCLVKFSKVSVLGHFCFAMIRIHDLTRCRKEPETVEIASIQEALTRYKIPHISFENFVQSKFPSQATEYIADDALYAWVCEQEEVTFCPLWEKTTDEVFHLLFRNRTFLVRFNLKLAEFRQQRGDSPSPKCGIPQWVKRAVYFRENGKCALCKKDLSGLIHIDPKQHYDHMVPLKALGINDPCNIQLLCAVCNLTKGASPARTSSLYDPWWE